jgi:hypothetical protein
MPTTFTLQLIVVWFLVGFFTGAGWALGCWIVGRTLGLVERSVTPRPRQEPPR